MSVFVVSNEHIDMMLAAGLHYADPDDRLSWRRGDDWATLLPDNADQVGAVLLAANIASVNQRYAEDELEPIYVFHRPHRLPTPVEALSGIACFEYQSDEVDDWSTSEAARFCQALRLVLIKALPGYADAPWEWSNHSD